MTFPPNLTYEHSSIYHIPFRSRGCVLREIVDILAPKTKNPNAPDPFGLTPIQHATSNGHGLKMEVKSKIRRVMPRRQCKIGPKRYLFKHYQRKKRHN